VPELPEVETIRRQIEPEVVGRTIVAARILDERWTRPLPPAPIAERLVGRRLPGKTLQAERARAEV